MACRAAPSLSAPGVLAPKWSWRRPIASFERLPAPLTWKVRKKSNASRNVTSQTSWWCSWARRMRKAVACMP